MCTTTSREPGSYTQIIFADFSSAFNMMKPSILVSKLTEMGVDTSSLLCKWILSYLRGRPQRVRVGEGSVSDTITTYIGAPQGCVLSPVLFTLYTNCHRGKEPYTFNSKYADDAALVGLISNNDESHYKEAVSVFAEVCRADELDLNVSKTKELIVDFRKAEIPPHEPLTINGSEVEIVSQYPYLGSTFMENLSWSANTDKLVAKAMKGLYGLRKLKEFRVDPSLMKLFYLSTIEGIITSGIVVWGGSLTKREKRSISRVRRCASRIIGDTLDHWDQIYNKRFTQFAKNIMADSTHPLNACFKLLPSGRRFLQIKSI